MAFAAGRGKDRWGSCGIKVGRGWPREFCLPNHRFNFRARTEYLRVVGDRGGGAVEIEIKEDKQGFGKVKR